MYQLEMNTYNEGKRHTLSLNVDSSEFSTVVLTYRESQIIMIILNPREIKVKKKDNGEKKPRRPTPFCGIRYPAEHCCMYLSSPHLIG